MPGTPVSVQASPATTIMCWAGRGLSGAGRVGNSSAQLMPTPSSTSRAAAAGRFFARPPAALDAYIAQQQPFAPVR